MNINNQLYTPSFGIYIKTTKTKYGSTDIGKYKKYNIEIYNDYDDKTKLYYVSDNLLNWVKSKFIYFLNGKKRTILSENKKVNYLL